MYQSGFTWLTNHKITKSCADSFGGSYLFCQTIRKPYEKTETQTEKIQILPFSHSELRGSSSAKVDCIYKTAFE